MCALVILWEWTECWCTWYFKVSNKIQSVMHLGGRGWRPACVDFVCSLPVPELPHGDGQSTHHTLDKHWQCSLDSKTFYAQHWCCCLHWCVCRVACSCLSLVRLVLPGSTAVGRVASWARLKDQALLHCAGHSLLDLATGGYCWLVFCLFPENLKKKIIVPPSFSFAVLSNWYYTRSPYSTQFQNARGGQWTNRHTEGQN